MVPERGARHLSSDLRRRLHTLPRTCVVSVPPSRHRLTWIDEEASSAIGVVGANEGSPAEWRLVRQRMDNHLREHGFDTVRERWLFSIGLSSPSALPRPLDLPPGNFACLLAWDSRGVPPDAVSAFVEPLLRAGASYFVCWGPDCERVHDMIDEMVSSPGREFGVPEGSCIMTTWHDSEPLREAIWHFLVNSWPDPRYQESTHLGLAVSIGCPAWAAEINDALDHPRDFIRRVSQNGAA